MRAQTYHSDRNDGHRNAFVATRQGCETTLADVFEGSRVHMPGNPARSHMIACVTHQRAQSQHSNIISLAFKFRSSNLLTNGQDSIRHLAALHAEVIDSTISRVRKVGIRELLLHFAIDLRVIYSPCNNSQSYRKLRSRYLTSWLGGLSVSTSPLHHLTTSLRPGSAPLDWVQRPGP